MKTILIIPLLFTFSFLSFSQEEKKQKLHLGIYMEGNYNFVIGSIDDLPWRVESNSSNGWAAGLSMEYQFTKMFSLIGYTGPSISETSMDLYYFKSIVNHKIVYNKNFDFRLHGKFAFGKKPSKPYLFFGSSIMIPLPPNKFATYTLKQTCFSADLGIGFDFKLKHFNIAPEINYSHGINNVSGIPLELYSHRLAFTLNFKI